MLSFIGHICVDRFHIGQSRWRRIQILGMSGDYTDKKSAISKWLVLFFGLSWWPLDEVGTAFANDIMYTIPADDRSRKFALITIWNPAVILHLTYGLQLPNKVR